MDANNLIGSLTLILAVWVFVIQLKQNELSYQIKKLTTKKQLQKQIEVKKDEPEQSSVPETAQPDSTSDIINENDVNPDDILPQTAPVADKKTNENTNFEKLFLGNLFNKIGAIAIIIAIGIFIKLIYPLVIFTPVLKTGLGFLAGFVLLLISVKLHRGQMKNYAEVLMGTGTAALFITTYCAYGLLHTLSMPAAVAIGTLILVGTYFAADKLQTTSMLTIGLIGGYLNPVFLNSNASADFVLGYLIFLNLLSLIYTYKNSEKSLINIINLPLTLCFAVYYSNKTELTEFLPFVIWGMYLLFNLLSVRQNRDNTVLNWLNYGFLTYFTVTFFEAEKTTLGIVLGITSLIYAILGGIYTKLSTVALKHSVQTVAVNIWLAAYFLTTDIQSIFIWSGEALGLVWLSVKNKAFKSLDNLAFLIYIAVFIGLFTAKYDGNLCITSNYIPILNMRLVLFGIPLCALLISSTLKDRSRDANENLYKYLAVLTGFVYSHFEAATFVANHTSMNISYLTSIVWIVYAGLTATAGIMRNSEVLKTSGIWLCLLAIARIFVYDIAALETVYKLLAFTVLGIILMIVSYFYIKKN